MTRIMQPFRLELPTGMPVGTVNSYLFVEPEVILVDAGLRTNASWAALAEGLAEHGLTVGDLSRVIITHTHVDHYGQAGRITEHSDADVWVSELGAPWLLETEVQRAQRSSFYRDHFLPALGLGAAAAKTILDSIEGMGDLGGPVDPGRVRTFSTTGTLQLGGRSWQILHTPGHASNQTCFLEPYHGTLLAADMLLATTPTPVVESPPDGATERVPALPQFLHSLALLERLDIALVLPGHGRPFDNHRQVIQRQRERIMLRKQECLGWIEAGYNTVSDLLDKMYAHHPAQYRFAGLWMLVGYLDLLLDGGAIEQRTIDGVWHYYPTSGERVA